MGEKTVIRPFVASGLAPDVRKRYCLTAEDAEIAEEGKNMVKSKDYLLLG